MPNWKVEMWLQYDGHKEEMELSEEKKIGETFSSQVFVDYLIFISY